MPYGQTPSEYSIGTTTMSNANNNPRSMSASDYTRVLKLRAMYDYRTRINNNVDVTNPSPGRSLDIYTGFGIGKYRRTASDWIAYRAAQTSDYVTMKDASQPGMGKILTVNQVCVCTSPTFVPSNIMGKHDICAVCKSRVVSTKGKA